MPDMRTAIQYTFIVLMSGIVQKVLNHLHLYDYFAFEFILQKFILLLYSKNNHTKIQVKNVEMCTVLFTVLKG